MMNCAMPTPEEERTQALKDSLAGTASPSERLRLLIDLSTTLISTAPAEARTYVEQAIRLARETRSYEEMAHVAKLMAEACAENGDLPAALEFAACMKEAGDASGSRRLQASYFYVCGVVHEDRGDYARARECYEQSRTLWRSDGFLQGELAVLNQLGNVCGLQGKVGEALACYQEALSLADELGDRENRGTTGFNVGWALQELGRWEDAVESYYRVLAIEDVPGIAELHANVYNSLGELFLRRDKLAKAVDMFKRVIDARPPAACSPVTLREALVNLGQAFHRQGDFAGASQAYDRALNLAEQADSRREMAIACWRAAELLLSQNALDRAWELNEKALALTREIGARREQSQALRVRGLILAAQASAGEASRSFEEAMGLLQDSEESYELAQTRFHYGCFLLAEGRKEEARTHLKAAARVFRKLSIVAEAGEINRLLFRQEMRADSDVALLQGISGLALLGLEPALLLDQALKLLREALLFDGAAVIFHGRPLIIQGVPDLARAQALSSKTGGVSTPTALSWPVRCAGTELASIYLDRAEPIEFDHSPLIFDTIANLLAAAVRRTAETALKAVEDRPDLAGLRYQGVIGRNPLVLKALGTICRVASAEVSVLIRGESGTGKELVARALHESGRRTGKPFVPVNCAALPENLLEAELFGIEQDAATEVAARKGKFEHAQGGTIFLDEIGDMSPALQARLLRVLQEKVVERVGGKEPVPVDVRVVAATNRDSDALMQRGTFSGEFYDRLNTVELCLPPLRERTEDIPDLVKRLITISNQEFGRNVAGASPEVLDRFRHYSWPGNIRELQQVVERAVILASGDIIVPADLPAAIRPSSDADAERALLLECLGKSDWNVNRAAQLSGYSRARFYRLMRKHGISRSGK
jgi:DNA-binding NtrC family response regulator/Tfp pilus assembly protein PilF